MEIKKILAKDGTEIIEVNQGDKTYRLNSAYRPYGEAEKFASQFKDLGSNSVLFVFGYGNGIIPEKIREACRDDVTIVYFEPCKEIYEVRAFVVENAYLYVKGVGVEKAVQKNQVCDGADFAYALEQLIDYDNYSKVECCVLPQYAQLFKEEYEDFVAKIKFRLGKVKSNSSTAKAFGKEALTNNIQNLHYLADSFSADSFIGKFPENMPAIIVSAGPSLEKNIDYLMDAKNKALIVCVDSAIKYLLNKDIEPDFLVCVDPHKPLNRFEHKDISKIPIVGSFDMNYKVLDLLKGSDVIFASGENSIAKKHYALKNHQLTRLRSGGSVATFAFSLCVYWGFKTIILIGQDLALTKDQMYAGGEKISWDNLPANLIPVEDVYGEQTYSPRDYYTYLKWFEQEVELQKDIRVIDSTEGGAKIKGTEILPLKESIELYAKEEVNLKKIIKEIKPVFADEDKIRIQIDLKQSKEILKNLIINFEEGISQIEEALKHPIKESNQPVDYLIGKICDDYNDLDVRFFVQRQIDATVLEEYMSVFQGMENCSKKEKYERFKRYFELLLEATKVIFELWDTVL